MVGEKQPNPVPENAMEKHMLSHTQELKEIKELAQKNLETQFAWRGKPWKMMNVSEKIDSAREWALGAVAFVLIMSLLVWASIVTADLAGMRGTVHGACSAVGGTVVDYNYAPGGGYRVESVSCAVTMPDGNTTTKVISLG